MTNAQIAARKDIYRRFRRLPDNKVTQVLEFLDSIEEECEPNEETIRAIEESYNPETLIECDDIQDMFRKCGVKCSG